MFVRLGDVIGTRNIVMKIESRQVCYRRSVWDFLYLKPVNGLILNNECLIQILS